MPYSQEHKQNTRKRIVECARILFNRHGFSEVTIDQVMGDAGLTRGGFYSHFKNKEALYAEAVSSFLNGRGAQWRNEAGVGQTPDEAENTRRMIDAYLSGEHLGDLEGQCPMIALPSDIARQNDQVRSSYQTLFEAMVGLFESNLAAGGVTARQEALSLATLCIGGMIIARTLNDPRLAEEVRMATHQKAIELSKLAT